MPILETILERYLEESVVRWAQQRGVFVTKLNLIGHRGMPDRVFWLPGGKPLLIEFKRQGAWTTKLQDHTISMLKGLGYAVHVCDNKEAAIRILRRALDAQSASQERLEVSTGARRSRSVARPRPGKD